LFFFIVFYTYISLDQISFSYFYHFITRILQIKSKNNDGWFGVNNAFPEITQIKNYKDVIKMIIFLLVFSRFNIDDISFTAIFSMHILKMTS